MLSISKYFLIKEHLTFINCLRFQVSLRDGKFYTSYSTPAEWTHVVLNYIGPSNDEGIRIYYDGAEVASDSTNETASHSAVDGRIVVGRAFTNLNDYYASVMVDELIYFNAVLKSDDVQLIYNSA